MSMAVCCGRKKNYPAYSMPIKNVVAASCVVRPKFKLRVFKTFTLVGLLGIGSLPSTLVGRSIIIYMQRAKLASYGNTSAPNARRRTNKS